VLINDGTGHFQDVTEAQLPQDNLHTVDVEFTDLDRDGDLDIVIANAFGGNYQVYFNDGAGFFTEDTASIFPAGVTGDGIDVEVADFNGDRLDDLFLTSYTSADIMLHARRACPFALGDLDGDEDVDRDDFAALVDCFAGPNASYPDGCECADLDSDCDVDIADFGVLQERFTGS